jgi:hypothetical protein
MDTSPEGASTRLAERPPPKAVAELIMAAQPARFAPKAVKARLTRRRGGVLQTVELLCHGHGGAKARKLAGREQKRARQARSRKQFAFWAAVAAELEKQLRAGIGQDEQV